MFYAVYRCNNEKLKSYNKPVGFITENIDGEDVPICRSLKIDLKKELAGQVLYEAGWVDIIYI
jgi:hypothetical protein